MRIITGLQFSRQPNVCRRCHFLQSFLPDLCQNDLLIITADHGNDPTYSLHTDHTREIVPLVIFSKERSVETYGPRNGFFHVSHIIKSHLDKVTNEP